MVAPVCTGEAEKEVARRYASGESFYRIAKDYRCGYQAVRRAVVSQGIPIRFSPKAQKLTPKEREEVVALYANSDLSSGQAAKRFGISGGHVGRDANQARNPHEILQTEGFEAPRLERWALPRQEVRVHESPR